MTEFSIRKLPFSKADARRFGNSFITLAKYKPPFVRNAGIELSKITSEQLGGKSLSSLEDKNRIIQETFNTFDYDKEPVEFAGIHTAIIKLIGSKGLKGKSILQVASNWGPYMHYLQHKLGAQAFGVDINKVAVGYAKQGGLEFIAGDASEMGFFQDNSFDLAVSHFFLEPAYLRRFFSNSAGNEIVAFMDNVMREIHRVLKPKGMLFSQGEDLRPLFSDRGFFSSVSILDISNATSIDILQK